MPYIPAHRRAAFPARGVYTSTGELNFHITKLLLAYLQQKGLSYTTINDINGALTGAAAEFQRRVAVPYENQKIEENGDVYPFVGEN